jgi:hypothetical protein
MVDADTMCAARQPPEVEGGSRPPRHLIGPAQIHRVGFWRFPVYELRQGDRVLARMGRSSWLKIYLGSGQRIELEDGGRWRLRSVRVGGDVVPMVVDDQRRRIAMSGMSHGTYGVNTKDLACALYPAQPGRTRSRWILRHFERELAVIHRNPMSIDAAHPVPLGMAFICFAIIRYGIFGETTPRLPAFRWG